MVDDVLINKAATIERCVKRARDEYFADPASFASHLTRQDAAVLNIQRACAAALDMGHVVIRRQQLGVPQSSRDVFTLLEKAQVIQPEQAETFRKIMGYRNIAVHDYQTLLLPVTVAIITVHLDVLLDFSRVLIKTA